MSISGSTLPVSGKKTLLFLMSYSGPCTESVALWVLSPIAATE